MFINLANAEMGFMRLLGGGPFKWEKIAIASFYQYEKIKSSLNSYPEWMDNTFKKLQVVLCFLWMHGVPSY
jgi:hypothetical protein